MKKADPFSISSIEFIKPGVVLVIAANERTARDCLKRNPRAQVQRSEHDESIGLLYSEQDVSFLNAIKRS